MERLCALRCAILRSGRHTNSSVDSLRVPAALVENERYGCPLIGSRRVRLFKAKRSARGGPSVAPYMITKRASVVFSKAKVAMRMRRIGCKRFGLALLLALGAVATGPSRPAEASQQTDVQVPSYSLKFGAFVARFDSGGAFTLEGAGWPRLTGNWKSKGDEIEISTTGGPDGCGGPGRYRIRVDGNHVGLDLKSDECTVRRMILDRSIWVPTGEVKPIVPRRIVRTAGAPAPS